MKLVTMVRDMRPYNAGHDVAVPDTVADFLIGKGDAKLSEKHASSGLKPDVAPPAAFKPWPVAPATSDRPLPVPSPAALMPGWLLVAVA